LLPKTLRSEDLSYKDLSYVPRPKLRRGGAWEDGSRYAEPA